MYIYTEDDDRSFAAERAARAEYDKGYTDGYIAGCAENQNKSRWIPASNSRMERKMTCKECERHGFCFGKPDKCGNCRNLIYENSGNYQIVSKYKNLPTEPRLCIIYMTWGDGQDPPQDAVQFATYSVDRGNFISQNNKVIPLKSIRAWCYVPR